jgi:pimeloyl-ACP methyl ester carboxylesterase
MVNTGLCFLMFFSGVVGRKGMSTYVLIHGDWHGGWCWDKVVSLLEEAGHKAVAPDLPGHRQDRTPLAEVTIDAYCNKVREVVEAQPEPVILVGHSMGGRVVTRVVEICPDRILCLVYIAAILLRNGEVSVPVDPDVPETLLDRSIIRSEDGVYRTLRGDAIRELFFDDCPDEVAEKAMALLDVRQAAQPFGVPMKVTEGNFGRVRRIYIECLRDKAMTPGQQRIMYANTPCERVISMNTGHSPFLSAPKELAGHLLSVR